jgi:hypothetical protein
MLNRKNALKKTYFFSEKLWEFGMSLVFLQSEIKMSELIVIRNRYGEPF